MSAATLEPLLRYLRRLGPASQLPDDSDALLLARFARSRDEEAFTLLVRRHGPLVWGVCTRLLSTADAEDAFQATFLILVRKASHLRRPEQLGPWLYGVARRVALKIRTTSARRREQTLAEAAMADTLSSEAVWRDLRPVLDEEVGRLPEKYRTPFVLCHLQGLTNEEAARRLGCPTGTVLSRLSRARERLRWRLSRRGVEVGSAALAAALGSGPGDAAVPAVLLTSTIRTGLALAGGTAVATTAWTLAEGVLHAMYLTKVKLILLGLVALGILGSGAGLLAHRIQAQSPQPKTVTVAEEPAQAKAAPKKSPVPGDKPSPPVLSEALRLEVDYPGASDNRMTLAEVLDMLHKLCGVNFDINEKAFDRANLKEVEKTEVASISPLPPMRAPLAAVLRKVLSRVPCDATFLVRSHAIEITTEAAVRDEVGQSPEGLLRPLVYEDFEGVPVAAAFKRLAEDSGLSLVVDSLALEASPGRVNAHLRNVPVDSAARVLADAAGLGASVVGNILYLTTREKAARMDREQAARLSGMPVPETKTDEAAPEKKPGRPSPGDAANPAAETSPAKKPAQKDPGRRP